MTLPETSATPDTIVHLLRHGEVHNPEAVLYGRLPGYRLSEDGLQMAHDAAEALRGRDVFSIGAAMAQTCWCCRKRVSTSRLPAGRVSSARTGRSSR